MMKIFICCIAFSMLMVHSAFSQANPKDSDSAVTGSWKGTSICQQKNTSCHDETVVYHISKSDVVDTFLIQANKIVNGAEVDMGTLLFRFDRQTSKLISINNKATWAKLEFNLKGKAMDGTLMMHGNVFRIINLVKQ